MMRSDEHNRHVHVSYAEETAPSSNVNVTDKEKSKEIIMHKNLSDVPANVIAELEDDEHIEPSVLEKGTSYFNIFECGINLLDKLDVSYQQAFISTISSTREIL